MTANTIYLLCAGGLVLGAIGVVIDRLNFPQRRFVAKGVQVSPHIGATRDRTGAHILDLEPNREPDGTPNHDYDGSSTPPDPSP